MMNYWRTLDNKYEVDILVCDALTHHVELAIEVKSSKNYTTTSLTAFTRKFGRKKIEHAYVIHPKSYKEENGIIYLPAYMGFCL